MLFTQLFLTLLMNALQQSLCFLEVTLLLGRHTKTLSSTGFQTWARTAHKKPKSSNLFYTHSAWFYLSHPFSTFARCFSCNRSTKALITSMASGNLFCSRLGKPCKYGLRSEIFETWLQEYNWVQLSSNLRLQQFLYDCESTPGRVQRQHIPRVSAESSAESCEFWHFHLHI